MTARIVDVVSGITEQAALDEHYAAHPEARPDRWEIAVAAARLDGHELANHPDLVRRAVDVLGGQADVDSALAWAAGAPQ